MGMNVAVQAAPPIRAGSTPPGSHNDGRKQMQCTSCHQIVGGAGGARAGVVAMNGMAMNVATPGVPPMIPAKASPPGNHVADGRASMVCSSCHQIAGAVQGNVVALALPNGSNGGLPLPQMLVNPTMGLNVATNGKIVVEGAELGRINPLLADELNLQVADGAFVTAVYPGSAAKRAGVMAGDIIFKLDGRWVLTPEQLMQRIAAMQVGDSLRLGIYRGGERMNLYLVVSGSNNQAMNSAPAMPPAGLANEIRWLGMELKPIGPEVVAKFPQLSGKQGSLVKDVKAATVAGNGGIIKGDVVLKINNTAVANAGQLDLAVAQANVRNGVLLLVERNGNQRYVTLQ